MTRSNLREAKYRKVPEKNLNFFSSDGRMCGFVSSYLLQVLELARLTKRSFFNVATVESDERTMETYKIKIRCVSRLIFFHM